MKSVSAANRVLWSGVLCLTAAARAAAPVPSVAIASVLDGPPFTLIRGFQLFTATRGTELTRGDLIETQPGTLLILEFKADSGVAVVAFGPSSRVYWMDRAGGVTMAVLNGWIKVDTLAPGNETVVEIQGRRLGAASGAGSYLIHAGDLSDEVFHENGSMTLRVRDGEGYTDVASQTNELDRRSADQPVETRVGTDAAFVEALPPAFRDPLPLGMAARLTGSVQPTLVRDVTYGDVADWLVAPRIWRLGFVRRFRARLKDPAFSKPLDAHLSAYPEWAPVLHPRPPATATPSDGKRVVP